MEDPVPVPVLRYRKKEKKGKRATTAERTYVHFLSGGLNKGVKNAAKKPHILVRQLADRPDNGPARKPGAA